MRGRMNWRMDGEFVVIIHKLLRHQLVLSLKMIVHHKVTNRLDHSIGVAYRSYKLAKRLGLNHESVARAALLHDLFVETRTDIKELMMGSHNAAHPRLALQNAKALCALSPKEEDIILSHMFLCTVNSPRPKFKESWVVTIVDKWCAIGERTRFITY